MPPNMALAVQNIPTSANNPIVPGALIRSEMRYCSMKFSAPGKKPDIQLIIRSRASMSCQKNDSTATSPIIIGNRDSSA